MPKTRGGRIIRLDPKGPGGVPLVATAFIKPEWVDEGVADERGHVYYTNPEGNTQVGFWECTSFRETIAFPYDEFGYVLEGTLELTDESGDTETFGPGDLFFIPRGTTVTWHLTELFKQYYMIFAPPEEQYYKL